MSLTTGPITLNHEDKSRFDSIFKQLLLIGYSNDTLKKQNPLILESIQLLKTKLELALFEPMQNAETIEVFVKETAREAYGLMHSIFLANGSIANTDSNTRANLGHLLLLICVLANNTLVHPEVAKRYPGDIEKFVEVNKIHSEYYQIVDLYCSKDMQADVYLQSLIKRVYESIKFRSIISKDELLFHIERKNSRNKTNQSYNGKLIDNESSTHVACIDPICLSRVLDEIAQIALGLQPRTQLIIRIFGRIGHVIALDVAYNSDKEQLEIICAESAAVKHQWNYLQQLINKMKERDFDFQIIAIQSRLQKSEIGCPIYTLALSGHISKFSFDSLLKYKPAEIKKEQSRIVFYDQFNERNPTLQELTPLTNVTWIPVTALGEKIIIMGQSMTEMKERLLTLYPANAVDTKIAQWAKLFDFDFSKRKTFYEYRRQALALKYEGRPFKDLNQEHVLEKLRTDPSETMTVELALRRQAAGFGPFREMKFLITELEELGSLDKLNSQGGDLLRTPLHWSILKGKTSRAKFLLSKGANSDVPDKNKKTAKRYFIDSNDLELRNDDYLRSKLGG